MSVPIETQQKSPQLQPFETKYARDKTREYHGAFLLKRTILFSLHPVFLSQMTPWFQHVFCRKSITLKVCMKGKSDSLTPIIIIHLRNILLYPSFNDPQPTQNQEAYILTSTCTDSSIYSFHQNDQYMNITRYLQIIEIFFHGDKFHEMTKRKQNGKHHSIQTC